MTLLRVVFKFFGFVLTCLWVIPSQSLVLLLTKGPRSYDITLLWHKSITYFFNVRYEIVGTPCTDKQVLYMSNHLSYLDIPLLGSILKASFVSKSDVADWPIFGFLATLQQTAFIKRKAGEAAKQKNALQSRINARHSLIIFPEGTSTDGQNVLPFKSSLFSLALGDNKEHLYIQPVTIQLVEIDGRKPVTQEDRDLYAWHRDMDTEMGAHLLRFAKISGAKLRVTFHTPIRAAEFQDRKELAKTCHDTVSKGLAFAKVA